MDGIVYPSRRDCTSWATDPQDRANGSAIPAGGKVRVRRRGEELLVGADKEEAWELELALDGS